MEGLPLLPGYRFCDATSKDYKLTQKLRFLNGFRVIRDNFDAEEFLKNAKFVEYNPELTYGRRKVNPSHEHRHFLPHWVIFERKTLHFEAYFRQGIFGSALEHFRVRRVNIFYYLDDDTLQVIEPRCDNAGFSQGKIVRRSKVPWPDGDGRVYHWKDLNVGMDIEIYGIVYRVFSCDAFTREFLTSQGIDVGEPESPPPDPYLQRRAQEEHEAKAGVSSGRERGLATDKRFRFLEYDGMVLAFSALWDERPYKVYYFLADDTVKVVEVQPPREKSGKGLLLKRTKIPKNWTDLPATYPGVYLEITDDEIREYYSPKDFRVGETIFIFGRRFFLYDCDPFTRRYYSEMLRIEQPPRVNLPDDPDERCMKECAKERSERAQDLVRKLYNFPKRLRYTLVVDVVHPEDEGREFILEYSLSDGAIRIIECERRNSGRREGCFLGWIRVPKPDGSEYYTPVDFYIGAKLNIFGHWFVITGTELFVYKYICANPQKFPEKIKANIKEYLVEKRIIQDDECKEAEDGIKVKREEGGAKVEPQEDFDDTVCCCKEGDCQCT